MTDRAQALERLVIATAEAVMAIPQPLALRRAKVDPAKIHELIVALQASAPPAPTVASEVGITDEQCSEFYNAYAAHKGSLTESIRAAIQAIAPILAAPLRAEVEALKREIVGYQAQMAALIATANNVNAKYKEAEKESLRCLEDAMGWHDRCAEQVEEIDRLQSQLRARRDDVVAAEILRGVLTCYDTNICPHDETHRGGTIWTICDGCGAKWADDEGGFKPHVDPPEIARARAVLELKSGEVVFGGSVQGQAGTASDPVLPASPEPSRSASEGGEADTEATGDNGRNPRPSTAQPRSHNASPAEARSASAGPVLCR